MKRGIIRIVAGSIMLFLQIMVIIAQSNIKNNYTIETVFDIFYYIGYFSTGIIGLVLLVFGCKAYGKGLRSEIILHKGKNKLNTLAKWISIPICLLIAASYIISAIQRKEIFDIFTILMVCCTLSLAVYLLFYLHKKPSCLFSTSLIFLGTTYLYGVCSNIIFYVLDLPEIDNYGLYIIFGLIPRIASGILYIVIATMLYKEHFSIQCIRVLGWTVLGLELSNRTLADILVFGDIAYLFYDITNLLLLFYIIAIFLYTSVFQLDTLRNNDICLDEKEDYLGQTHHETDSAMHKISWLKVLCIITVTSVFLFLLSGIAYNLTYSSGRNYRIFEVISNICLIMGIPSCVICVTLFVHEKAKKAYLSSMRYRENCYKKVARMKEYLDSGIITEEEFEKNKAEILRDIKL